MQLLCDLNTVATHTETMHSVQMPIWQVPEAAVCHKCQLQKDGTGYPMKTQEHISW